MKVHNQPMLGVCSTDKYLLVANTCIVRGSWEVQKHSQLKYHCGKEETGS